MPQCHGKLCASLPSLPFRANRALFSGVSEADLCGSEAAAAAARSLPLSAVTNGSREQEGERAPVVVSLPGLVGPQDERGEEGEEGREEGGEGMDGVREAGRSTVRGSEGAGGAAGGSVLVPVEQWEAARSSQQGPGDAALPSSNNQQQQHGKSLQQLAASIAAAVPGMVTLGMLPRSQWLSLSSIDVIKVTRHIRLSSPSTPPPLPRSLALTPPSLPQPIHLFIIVTSSLWNSLCSSRRPDPVPITESPSRLHSLLSLLPGAQSTPRGTQEAGAGALLPPLSALPVWSRAL